MKNIAPPEKNIMTIDKNKKVRKPVKKAFRNVSLILHPNSERHVFRKCLQSAIA